MTADADRRTVAARLAAERTRRGLTKRELGRRLASQVTEQCPSLDTLVSYVKRWEAGQVSVSDRYRHAAEILDTLPPGFRSQMITETGRRVLAAVPRAGRDGPAVRDLADVITATAPASAQLAG
jgi:transcriptional regulator with XRE-family HTH domain